MVYIIDAHRIIQGGKEREIIYMSCRKLISNRSCGILPLMMQKLQKTISPSLDYNLLESIRDLQVQSKQKD